MATRKRAILKKAVRKKALKPSEFSREVGIALQSAAREARKVARMHGTPIYVVRNGKIVAVKP